MSRTNDREEAPTSAVPEDVAALYAWADLPDATYQDFSAARRKLRSRLSPPEPAAQTVVPTAIAPTAYVSALGWPSPLAAVLPSVRRAVPQEPAPPPVPPEAAAAPSAQAPPLPQGAYTIPADASSLPAPGLALHDVASSADTLPASSLTEPPPPRLWLWSPSILPRPRSAFEEGAEPASPQPTFSTEETLSSPSVNAPAEVPPNMASSIPARQTLAPAPHYASPDPPQAPPPAMPHAASRWTSLDAALPSPGPSFARSASVLPAAPEPPRVPITAIFALTGGSGKTCLLATLGRLLASSGESVVLAETGALGPLPLYFAADDLHPQPESSPSANAPIALARYDLDAAAGDPVREAQFLQHFVERGRGAGRLLIDLSERAGWFLRRLAGPALTVLIPVTPTMSSVITLQAVERFFRDCNDAEGCPILPHYLINQFDEEHPVHRDVRDFLNRRVGDRLLPTVIRSSPGIGQAFARGMTVVDFAPHAPVSEDYRAVADWLRTTSPPAPPVPPAQPAPRTPSFGRSPRWLHR